MDSAQQKKAAKKRYAKQAIAAGKSSTRDLGSRLARHAQRPSRRSLRSAVKGASRSRTRSERSRTGDY